MPATNKEEADEYADMPATNKEEADEYADMPALMPLPDEEEADEYADMPALLPPPAPARWIHPYIFHRDRELFTPIDDLPPLISDSSDEEDQSSDGYEASGEE